jgi:hypothetical protein
LTDQNTERSLGSGWYYPIPKESKLVGTIVTGDVQLGIVQPIGTFINVSTQRGFSLPLCVRSTIGVSSL